MLTFLPLWATVKLYNVAVIRKFGDTFSEAKHMRIIILALILICQTANAQSPSPTPRGKLPRQPKHSERTIALDLLHANTMQLKKERDEIIIKKRRELQDKQPKERYSDEAKYLEAVKTTLDKPALSKAYQAQLAKNTKRWIEEKKTLHFEVAKIKATYKEKIIALKNEFKRLYQHNHHQKKGTASPTASPKSR